ncbi:MAG: UDP-N-acetylmuramoyl-L-alanyl-D-glutamate--2,6-diaminopimelate ligase [Rikenellaceae bacterium]
MQAYLLDKKYILEHIEASAKPICSVCFDSRKVEQDSLFVAVVGTSSDGHDYIGTAIDAGATTIVCQSLPSQVRQGVEYIRVEDSNIALGRICSAFYGNPSSKLKLVGVTGTNGKTTTATLLYDLFTLLGYKVGLISTVIYRVGTKSIESTHTTPDSLKLNMLLKEMVDEGCDYCFMEVSSHSLVQHRVEGLRFAGAVFSNITHDHLDYHHTFAAYIAAKKMLFDSLDKSAFALINADDRNGSVMVQNCKAKCYTYSTDSRSDFGCRILETHPEGMLLKVDDVDLCVNFLGRFNASNLLCVYGTALLLGAERQEVLEAMSQLRSVAGRFETIRSNNGITAIVDYAHTPDALQNVLDTISEIKFSGKVITVVGCGGNRDATKRPKMARIAVDNSSLAILTSDNPRFEKPEAIIEDMKSSLDACSKYLAIVDRTEAIRTAVMMAERGDIILIAGKGHEPYQEVCGVRHHFDDREQVREMFENLNK